MRMPYESHISPCRECGFAEVPTFRVEQRLAYREVGEPGGASYSRDIAMMEEVLVCLKCDAIADSKKLLG